MVAAYPRLALSFLFVLAASCATAQEMCEISEVSHTPPCMVGMWSGTSDMEQRLNDLFGAMAPDIIAQARAGSGDYLFLRVATEGWFFTSPLEVAVDAMFEGDNGGLDEFTAQASSYGTVGVFQPLDAESGTEGEMRFCTADIDGTVLRIDGSTTEGIIALEHDLPDFGEGSVALRYECIGQDGLNLMVDLPPPIGTITYALQRVASGDVPVELEEMTWGLVE